VQRLASQFLIHFVLISRFWIGIGGGLTAIIGPRQAIAVHTGALGTANPAPKTVPQVSVLFYEDATTTPGEVGVPF